MSPCRPFQFCLASRHAETPLPCTLARRPKSELIAQILRAFEAAGDAMRYLDADGRVAWKASPRMRARLADAEREAREDLADW